MPDEAAAPIAVLSFDRPDLLAAVLATLAAQRGGVAGDRVHLFQDGHHSIFQQRDVADRAKVEACVAAFRDVFPSGRVHVARRNLGVAGNMGRAERYLLGLLRSPVAYFFEDDMLLAPHYLQALDALAALALGDARIGYVAAYGQNRFDESVRTQDPGDLVPMEHNWGFALTRRHWLEQQPIMLPYRRLIAGMDYRNRPHRRIQQFFWSLGYGSEGTSQDTAKHVASLVLGRLRLRCGYCYGRYVGQAGLHMNISTYDKYQYGAAQLYLQPPPPRFNLPDDARIAHLLEAQRNDGRQRHGILSDKLLPAAPDLTTPLDAARFVRVLYRGLLGREPDAAGGATYTRGLETGTFTADQLLRAFLASREYRDRFTA